MCLAQISGTLLIYINTPIAVFDSAIFFFLPIFAFLFQLQKYISAQAKPAFASQEIGSLLDATVESGNFCKLSGENMLWV